MSVREEDRQKNCPSRGLGIAAAAIGVGVGAALYYFFNKRAENPNGEGSTSEWTCEEPHALDVSDNDNSYFTVSEHSTSDTSFHNSTMDDTSMHNSSSDSNSDINDITNETQDTSDESEYTSSHSSSQSETSLQSGSSTQSDSDGSNSPISNRTRLHIPIDAYSHVSIHANQDAEDRFYAQMTDQLRTTHGFIDTLLSVDSENEWDVTESSLHIPNEERRRPMRNFFNNLRQRVSSPRVHRERSWTIEECSICFDVMLQTQEVMALACTHRFHQQCILPWLQERQTCPNCRKVA